MPLILAVEPDRKQAAKITAIARGPLGAELVVAASAAGALALLAKRVPDLILTSQLLSPREEATLADRLRELDGAGGTRVQTLMIPVLAAPEGTREAKGGLLSRFRQTRGGDVAPAGCDPALFSAQIAEYLERAREEREAEAMRMEPEAPPSPVLSGPLPVTEAPTAVASEETALDSALPAEYLELEQEDEAETMDLEAPFSPVLSDPPPVTGTPARIAREEVILDSALTAEYLELEAPFEPGSSRPATGDRRARKDRARRRDAGRRRSDRADRALTRAHRSRRICL